METDDKENVQRAIDGDKEAYCRLVDSYKNKVFAVALSITGNPSDSQDIMQETFLRAYQKLRCLSNAAHFGSWLHSISKRVAISFLRKKQRIARQVVHGFSLEEIQSNAESPADAYSRKELTAIILKHVNNLPEKAREAVLLYYMEGFSVKSAAAFLSISENAMSNRLHYARIKLRNNINEKVEKELRQLRPSTKTRNYILAALPAGGVPQISFFWIISYERRINHGSNFREKDSDYHRSNHSWSNNHLNNPSKFAKSSFSYPANHFGKERR